MANTYTTTLAAWHKQQSLQYKQQSLQYKQQSLRYNIKCEYMFKTGTQPKAPPEQT
jgi:hypothetical protein